MKYGDSGSIESIKEVNTVIILRRTRSAKVRAQEEIKPFPIKLHRKFRPVKQMVAAEV